MKLTINHIKEIATGAAQIEVINGKICFSRYTDEQRHLYKNRDADCYLRSLSSSGIKLSFSTNSKSLTLAVDVAPGSSRKYFSFDVFSGETCIGHLYNFNEDEMPQKYIDTVWPLEKMKKTFLLGDGTKKITIYFPWSVNTMLEELSLDDGATVVPENRTKTLLAFGVSITQGYDALRPSDTYVARLARALNADEINKGIGGETFFPELAKTKEIVSPDIITVAYGTNDWSLSDKETYKKNCTLFFQNLRNTYETAKIFAITPIWRTDVSDVKKLGSFPELAEVICAAVQNFDITTVSGLEMVPHEKSCFADLFVHPNDYGFEYFYKNLYQKIIQKGDF